MPIHDTLVDSNSPVTFRLSWHLPESGQESSVFAPRYSIFVNLNDFGIFLRLIEVMANLLKFVMSISFLDPELF